MMQETQTPDEVIVAQNETTDDSADQQEKESASPYDKKKTEILGIAASRLDKVQFQRLNNAIKNLESAISVRQRQEFAKTLPDSFGRFLPDLKTDLKELTSLYEDTMKEKTPMGRKELQQRRERLEALKNNAQLQDQKGIANIREQLAKVA